MYGILSSQIYADSDAALVGVFTTPLRISSEEPARLATTLSYRSYSSTQRAHQWVVTADIAPSESGALFAVLLRSLLGVPLQVRMPQPVGSKAANSYGISGWQGSAEPWAYPATTVSLAGAQDAIGLDVGDFFTFTGALAGKVHVVRSKSIGANPTVTFWPQTKKVANSGEAPVSILSGNHCLMAAFLSPGAEPTLVHDQGLVHYPTLELLEIV